MRASSIFIIVFAGAAMAGVTGNRLLGKRDMPVPDCNGECDQSRCEWVQKCFDPTPEYPNGGRCMMEPGSCSRCMEFSTGV